MRIHGRMKVGQMQRRIAQLRDKLSAQASHALAMEANAVMRAAKRKAPYDGGDLEESGKVDPVVRDSTAGMMSVRLSFGDEGPASDYALAIHEVHSPHDPPSWIGKDITFHTPGTGPKYLEEPLFEAASGMDDRIARRIKL